MEDSLIEKLIVWVPVIYAIFLPLRIFFIRPKPVDDLSHANTKQTILLILLLILTLAWFGLVFSMGDFFWGDIFGASWSALAVIVIWLPICAIIHLIYEITYSLFAKSERKNNA